MQLTEVFKWENIGARRKIKWNKLFAQKRKQLMTEICLKKYTQKGVQN